jgi:predicted DNA-binding helix-hairpin-helix protein
MMNQHFLKEKDGQKLQIHFLELRKQLSTLEWITHGSVTPNHPGNWRWTTKIKAKTVTLSLSAEQADLFKQAIAANRRAKSILNKMRSISQEILLKSAPGTRKKSSRKIIPNGS